MTFTTTLSFSRFEIGVDADGDGITGWFCDCCEVPDGAEWLEDASRDSFPTCEVCGAEAEEEDDEEEEED